MLPALLQLHGWQPLDVKLKESGVQTSHVRPVVLSGQGHCPVVTSQEEEVENIEQAHGVHPSEVKLKWFGRQASHVALPTPGLQLHCPVSVQIGDREPVGSQPHAMRSEYKIMTIMLGDLSTP